MNKDYAQEVAARIIEQLQQGTAPWQKPWKPGELQLPYNAATGKAYRGMNTMWLHMQGYADPRWMTYKQAEGVGAQVRKGSKGARITYFKFYDEKPMKDDQGRPVLDADGKPRTTRVELDRPQMFGAVVFNAEQIDGLPALTAKPTAPAPERHARAEAILANSGAKITHVAGDRAFYRPSTDSITLPLLNQFSGADTYYATALHELGHWTGHESRLARDLSHPFGSEGYAKEELRAEIASLMLGERLDIGHDPGAHAAYVGSWIKALQNDHREIFRAAADAEKIHAYVMAFEHEQAHEKTQGVVAEIGQRARFTPNAERVALGGMTIEGVVVDAARTQAGNTRYRIRTDEIAPQDGQPQEWLVYTNHGSIEQLPGRGVDTSPIALTREREQRVPVLQEPPEVGSMTPQRTYLIVPYREKDTAKKAALDAGFRLQWDKEAKQWYAPEGVDVKQSALARWLPENTKVQVERVPSPEQSFGDAIRAAGLALEGAPDMDGKIHRVAVAGDKGGERSGAYAGHLEGRIPGGYIQNYKTGERTNWRYEGKVAGIGADERERQNREAVERAGRRAAELAAKHETMAKIAQALWDAAPPAPADHPYCVAKGIERPGVNGLRVVPQDVPDEAKERGVRIAKTVRTAKAMRDAEPDARVFIAGDLLIPARDGDGKLWTVQSVNPQFKGFMKAGRKTGLYTVAGADPSAFAAMLDNDPTTPLMLAEGYATADTVARLRGHPVVAAFDSGNLDAVARSLRERWPDRPLLIAADNDHRAESEVMPDGKVGINVGLKKGQEAAGKHGGAVVAPGFAATERGSDWNDYAQQHGDEAARREMERVVAQAKIECAMNADRMASLAREREAEARNDPTTSADDAFVASERAAAHGLIGRAVAGSAEVRAQATDALAANASGGVRPLAAAIDSLDRTNAEQADEIMEQRQAVQDGHNDSKDSERAAAWSVERRAGDHRPTDRIVDGADWHRGQMMRLQERSESPQDLERAVAALGPRPAEGEMIRLNQYGARVVERATKAPEGAIPGRRRAQGQGAEL